MRKGTPQKGRTRTGDAQRREFFRMNVRLSLLLPTPRDGESLQPVSGVPFIAPRIDGADYRILCVEDLSGGGCRCVDAVDWLGEGCVYPGFLYLGDDDPPLPLELLVVRRDPDAEDEASAVPRVAFRFVRLKERNRQRILRVLFQEYRRQRRSERALEMEPMAPTNS